MATGVGNAPVTFNDIDRNVLTQVTMCYSTRPFTIYEPIWLCSKLIEIIVLLEIVPRARRARQRVARSSAEHKYTTRF